MLCHSVIAFDYELFNLINSDEFGIWLNLHLSDLVNQDK